MTKEEELEALETIAKNKEQLKIFLVNISQAVADYNKIAKELGDFSRAAYLINDFNEHVLDIKYSGEEISSEWLPITDYEIRLGGKPKAPEASGWFPSRFC